MFFMLIPKGDVRFSVVIWQRTSQLF